MEAFVATSNESAREAVLVDVTEKCGIKEVLLRSPTFARAFDQQESEGCSSRPSSSEDASQKAVIVQSSRTGKQDQCVPAQSGLATTICQAYNRHHELELRPDDVWQAVLTQFSFYVQAHAEELRDRIVDFQGKKQLIVTSGGTLFTADFANIALRMVDEEIVKNIKDPSMAAWLLPDFSTTEQKDRVVASVSIMATLQAFFEYKFCLDCGIPRVKLLGEPADWQKLRSKIDRLPDFDLQEKHMSAWYELLKPVFDNFVQSANGNPDLSFWDTVCSHMGGGSGPSYLSGWVTVFMVFTEKGVWQGKLEDKSFSCQGKRHTGEVKWPQIDTNDIPVASVAVPVLVDDNGTKYETQMLAGQFAFNIISGGKGVQPRSDWCIALPKSALPTPRNILKSTCQSLSKLWCCRETRVSLVSMMAITMCFWLWTARNKKYFFLRALRIN